MQKPKEVNILGIPYKIIYVEKPSDVDIHQRESLFGQIDPWTRTIRIFDQASSEENLWETLIHEFLHGIVELLHLKSLDKKEHHDELDLLALALTDMLFRNGWFKKED